MDEANVSIGEMAALNCVSERALRFYQSKGLLHPDRIDDSNGYRYYSLEQSSTIDMIIEFEELGFSIDEIRGILEHRDIESLEAALAGRIDALEQSICQQRSALADAQRLLASCQTIRESPLFNVIMIENIPKRTLVNFDIFHEAAVKVTNDGEAFMREWEINLRQTKRAILDQGLPRSLFRGVGCRIAQDDLLARNFRLSGSFVMINREHAPEGCALETIPAGRYLTLYTDHYVSCDGSNAELSGLETLLAYADEHHFEIVGDYLGEIIADTPAFDFDGRDMLFKQQIPVAVATCGQ